MRKVMNWVDVDFEAAEQTVAKQGKVIASYQPIKSLPTRNIIVISLFRKCLPTGKLQTLYTSKGDMDMGGGATWRLC